MAEKIIASCLLVWLVLMGCTAAYAEKWPTNNYQCVANVKLSRYSEKGSAPGAITLSGVPELCAGSGADVTCGGGHDCDNERNAAGCNCRINETCIREWDNANNPYIWWVYGYAYLENTWSTGGNALNRMAHIRAYPTMIYSPHSYTVNVAPYSWMDYY